jgi:N6-adenosine-specific RNA methylase IME4
MTGRRFNFDGFYDDVGARHIWQMSREQARKAFAHVERLAHLRASYPGWSYARVKREAMRGLQPSDLPQGIDFDGLCEHFLARRQSFDPAARLVLMDRVIQTVRIGKEQPNLTDEQVWAEAENQDKAHRERVSEALRLTFFIPIEAGDSTTKTDMFTFHVADKGLSGGKSPSLVIASVVCNCISDQLHEFAESRHLHALLWRSKYIDDRPLLPPDVPSDLDVCVRPSSPIEIAKWQEQKDAAVAEGRAKGREPSCVILIHASDELTKLRRARDTAMNLPGASVPPVGIALSSLSLILIGPRPRDGFYWNNRGLHWTFLIEFKELAVNGVPIENPLNVELLFYDEACRAIAEAVAVDEVLEIRNRSLAMHAYAKQAKNHEMEADAFAIRKRAERRLGGMIEEQKQGVGLNRGGGGDHRVPRGPGAKPTLAEAGIDKHLADRARKAAAVPEEQFLKIVDDGRERIAREQERTDKRIVQAAKKAKREKREAELAKSQMELPVKRYGVILADPEWRFEPWSRETGMDRAADNHYLTADLDVIASRDVPSIAADDCVLFLWATVPMLRQALSVMHYWHFEYVSHCIWVKDRLGTGYWFRNKHELLLVGTRGEIPAPAMGEQWASAIEAPVGEHSIKPEVFYTMIEHYYPTLPKIELNARRSRPGWDSWGNEVDKLNGPVPIDHVADRNAMVASLDGVASLIGSTR